MRSTPGSGVCCRKTIWLVPRVIKYREESQIIIWRCNRGNVSESGCIYAMAKERNEPVLYDWYNSRGQVRGVSRLCTGSGYLLNMLTHLPDSIPNLSIRYSGAWLEGVRRNCPWECLAIMHFRPQKQVLTKQPNSD